MRLYHGSDVSFSVGDTIPPVYSEGGNSLFANPLSHYGHDVLETPFPDFEPPAISVREVIFEYVRRERFSLAPSRLSSLLAFVDMKHVAEWEGLIAKQWGFTYEVEASGGFQADAGWLWGMGSNFVSWMTHANEYWSGAKHYSHSMPEVIIPSPVIVNSRKVVRIR